ncbi:endonuclease, partial [Erwinia amylovora]|nr:endonuclease [Erwinia amylovora]
GLITLQQPFSNPRLRKNRQLCAMQRDAGSPMVVYSKDLDFYTSSGLFGLYANLRAALVSLHLIAVVQRLCYFLLGLAHMGSGNGCLRFAIMRCAGSCC